MSRLKLANKLAGAVRRYYEQVLSAITGFRVSFQQSAHSKKEGRVARRGKRVYDEKSDGKSERGSRPTGWMSDWLAGWLAGWLTSWVVGDVVGAVAGSLLLVPPMLLVLVLSSMIDAT
ncbi:hypothetical protein V1478_008296 [Vespula squamosa]|uniref:Uncharacterized protein n=1 Tax=Vespula squamosa TaxID=30214 RepID=A0ABD2AYE2_VESSQ